MNKKPIITRDAVRAVSAELPTLAGRLLTGALALLLVAAAFMPGVSHAGTNTYYYNSPSSTDGLNIIGGGGGGYVQPSGGSPNDPEAGNSATNGYFAITDAANSEYGTIIFPDFDSGQVVTAFKFSCDVRIGAGRGRPADGFSICFARTNDPVLVNWGWAVSEEGTQTGLAVCFDTYDNGGGDVIGLTIRVDNNIITNVPLPYLNLAPGDPNFAASLQTGTNDAGLAGLTWQPLSVEYTINGLLNVAYKGVSLLTNFPTGFAPTAGRFILGGRTGGENEYQHLDNLRIVTIPTTTPRVPPHFQNLGLNAGQFGFDLDGEPGRKLLLQASSDLKYWVTLWACQLTNTPLGFVDPESPLHPKRFYRLMAAEGVALMEQPGWLGGQFNLNLAGELGRTVVIEASTNLIHWLRLATNTLGATPLYFSDPGSASVPARFYRARLP